MSSPQRAEPVWPVASKLGRRLFACSHRSGPDPAFFFPRAKEHIFYFLLITIFLGWFIRFISCCSCGRYEYLEEGSAISQLRLLTATILPLAVINGVWFSRADRDRQTGSESRVSNCKYHEYHHRYCSIIKITITIIILVEAATTTTAAAWCMVHTELEAAKRKLNLLVARILAVCFLCSTPSASSRVCHTQNF